MSAPINAHAVPSTADDLRAKWRKLSRIRQKKSRSCGSCVLLGGIAPSSHRTAMPVCARPRPIRARSSVDLQYFRGLISAAVMAPNEVHLDLDHAWRGIADDLPRIDATKWGPPLRFSTPPQAVEQFYRDIHPPLG